VFPLDTIIPLSQKFSELPDTQKPLAKSKPHTDDSTQSFKVKYKTEVMFCRP